MRLYKHGLEIMYTDAYSHTHTHREVHRCVASAVGMQYVCAVFQQHFRDFVLLKPAANMNAQAIAIARVTHNKDGPGQGIHRFKNTEQQVLVWVLSVLGRG